MARVTVEDCVDKVKNRFELVLLSAHRSRAIASGSQITIERDNDKNPVVALREIADQTIIPAELQEAMIQSMQKYAQTPDDEAEIAGLIASADEDPGIANFAGDRMSEEELLRGIEGFGSGVTTDSR